MATTDDGDGDGEVHRIGFTWLKGSGAPKHGPFRANIVFVHGLGGCPRRTWEAAPNDQASFVKPKRGLKTLFRRNPPRSEGSSSLSASTPTRTPSANFWPKDYLANDLPGAKVWTYGYNSDLFGGVFQAGNKNSISQHGRDLAVQIERDVLTANGYPVLFVAHSLGGIIVKDAIKRSQACQQRCRLVVFLGTPHRGSPAADWGRIAANLTKLALQDPNPKVLDALQVDNEVLDNIHQDFIATLDQATCRIRVHSFQEARAMTGIKGLSEKVVLDFSSKLGLSQRAETVESIDADHRQMARCPSRSCPQYRAIFGVLKDAIPPGEDVLTPHGPVLPSELSSQVPVAAALPAAAHSLRPCHYIPIPRNQSFVGRQVELDTLKQTLFVDGKPAVSALVGLGGAGKTQVALQLAYWAKETKPHLSVFWVPALSDSTFRQACADILRELAITTSGDDDPRVLLRQHLDSADAGEWLLIVDNADDEALVFGENSTTTGGLMAFLPQKGSGKTLITTRSGKVADDAARGEVVHLGEMSPDDAMLYLTKSLNSKDGVPDAFERKELLVELECLPLAITQAAAYLNQNYAPISEYLDLLRGTPQELISLMSYEFRDKTRYNESNNAIATTWLVSFGQILKSDPVAADLLTFISFIQPKAIPRSLLPPCESREQMTRAIGTLCAYSFLSSRGENKMFDMHSLVHMATQIWVRRGEFAAQEAEKAICHVEAVFPEYEHKNRFLWREYMPHALKLLEGAEGHDIAEKYSLFGRVGLCLHDDNRIKEAVWCHEQAYQWRSENFPEEDASRLHAQHNLASIYLRDGQTQRSLTLLEGVVGIRDKVLAEDHRDRLTSQHELARAYLENGEVEKAIDLLEVVVRMGEKVQAEDHPDRLDSQHVLAGAYLEIGKVQKAIDLLEVVVRIEEKVQAEDHHDRLDSQHELARAYLENGEVKKAIDLLEVVVRMGEKVQAEDHPHRVASQHVLAQAYLADGQVDRAIGLLDHVVKMKAGKYDEGDSRLLDSQYELAKAYLADGQVDRAVELLEQVVKMDMRTLDEGDSRLLISQGWLAKACLADGQVDRAIELLEHVVKTKTRIYGEGDPRLLNSQGLLDEAYAKRNQGQDIEGRAGDAVAGEDEEGREQDAEGMPENAVAGDSLEAGSPGVQEGSGQ